MEKEVGLDFNREMRVVVKWLHRKCQHTKKGLRVAPRPFLFFGSVRQGTVCSLAGVFFLVGSCSGQWAAAMVRIVEEGEKQKMADAG